MRRSARYDNNLDCDYRKEAIAAKYDCEGGFTKENWEGLLGHHMAITDFPCAVPKSSESALSFAHFDQAFGPELITAYPQAKVILTT